jgi:hypothetical protein
MYKTTIFVHILNVGVVATSNCIHRLDWLSWWWRGAVHYYIHV